MSTTPMKANHSLAATSQMQNTDMKNASAVTRGSVNDSSKIYDEKNKLLISQLQQSMGKYQSEYFQQQIQKLNGFSDDEKKKKVEYERAKRLAEESIKKTNTDVSNLIQKVDQKVDFDVQDDKQAVTLNLDESGKKVMPLSEDLLLDKKEKKARKEHNRLKLQLKEIKSQLEEIDVNSHRNNLHIIEQKELNREKEQILYKKAVLKTKMQKVKQNLQEIQTQKNDNPRMTSSHPMVRSFFLNEENKKREQAEQFIKEVREKQRVDQQDLQTKVENRKKFLSEKLESFKKTDEQRKKDLNQAIEKRFKQKMTLLKTRTKKRLEEIQQFQLDYLEKRKKKDQEQWEQKLALTTDKKGMNDSFSQSYKYQNPDLLKQLPDLQAAHIRMKREYEDQNKMDQRLRVQTALADLKQNHVCLDEMYLPEHEANYYRVLNQKMEEQKRKRGMQLQRYFSPDSYPRLKYESTHWKEEQNDWENSPDNPRYKKQIGQTIQTKRRIYGSVVNEENAIKQKTERQIEKEIENKLQREIRVDKLQNPQKYVLKVQKKKKEDYYLDKKEFLKKMKETQIQEEEVRLHLASEQLPARDPQEKGKVNLQRAKLSIAEDLKLRGKEQVLSQIFERTKRNQVGEKTLFALNQKEDEQRKFLESSIPTSTQSLTIHSKALSEAKLIPQESIFSRPDYLNEMRFQLSLETKTPKIYRKEFNQIMSENNAPLFSQQEQIKNLSSHLDKQLMQQDQVLRNSSFAPGMKEVQEMDNISQLYVESIQSQLDLIKKVQQEEIKQNKCLTTQNPTDPNSKAVPPAATTAPVQ